MKVLGRRVHLHVIENKLKREWVSKGCLKIIALYSVWRNRNEVVFSQTASSVESIMTYVKALTFNVISCRKHAQVTQMPNQGIVLRDDKGRVKLSYASNLSICLVLYMKLWVILNGIRIT